jgi:hypothetical protein
VALSVVRAWCSEPCSLNAYASPLISDDNKRFWGGLLKLAFQNIWAGDAAVALDSAYATAKQRLVGPEKDFGTDEMSRQL